MPERRSADSPPVDGLSRLKPHFRVSPRMARLSSVPRASIWGRSRVSNSASVEGTFLPSHAASEANRPVRVAGESRQYGRFRLGDYAARLWSRIESVWRALRRGPRRNEPGVMITRAILHMTTKGWLCCHGDNDRAASMQRRAIRPLRIGTSIQCRHSTGLRPCGRVAVLPAPGRLKANDGPQWR